MQTVGSFVEELMQFPLDAPLDAFRRPKSNSVFGSTWRSNKSLEKSHHDHQREKS